jgi:hypothetical protein
MTITYTHFAGEKAHETAAKDCVTRAARCINAASALMSKGGSTLDAPFSQWFGDTPDPGPVMDWTTFKNGTSRTMSLRNGELGTLDTALKAYHDPSKIQATTIVALYNATVGFINAKNNKYATSGGLASSKRESKSNAISTLWSQVQWAYRSHTNPLAGGKYGDVGAKIARMADYVNRLDLTIAYAGNMLSPNTNAEATHFNEKDTRSYQGRQASSQDSAVLIKLPERFFTQLSRTQSDDQTQIETLIHELSHVAAGTKDMERADHTTNPQPCYGRINALNLAVNFPDQARDNAENYGFFIVQVGGETQVSSKLADPSTGKKWATVETGKGIR